MIEEPLWGPDAGWSKSKNWSWCDAHFMAPPGMARIAKATGQEKYLDLMDKLFWDTYEYIYDKEEKLYYRDINYIVFPDGREQPYEDTKYMEGPDGKQPLSPSGKKIFWGRGNGWVLAGLARTLEYLPKDYPSYPRYLSLFQEMTNKISEYQQEDGLWRSSLNEPAWFPNPETSSSSMFCYAMASGINNGLLDRQKFLPIVNKAWMGLVDCVQPEGRLAWVQLTGHDPRIVNKHETVEYGSGAFLLAGNEMLKIHKSPGPRITSNINTNWTFSYSADHRINKDFLSLDFNDKAWQIVALPHTWQTYETTGDLHPFIKNASERDDPYWWKGWGYYRKHFTPSKALSDKKITVELDGVQKYSRVYLNGEYVGDHKGGFTSFYFDLTPFVRFGSDNVLVIAVSNRRDDKHRIPPMTAGNWNVYGGIYRDARLLIKDKVHIPFQGSYKHEGGTFITTPSVNENEAVVNIKTYVKNDSEIDTRVNLKTSVISPKGILIEEIETSETIEPGTIHEFDQTSLPVQNPHLWHPGSPSLYRVKSDVYVDGILTDAMESPLGFRYFHWDYEKNDLWLNGEKILIRGFNRHQEYPWVGDAIPKWLTEKDFVDLRENLGINFFRAAHYPNDKQVYNLADKLGMIAVEEVPNIKAIDFDEEVQKQNVMEMIRRDRNHPSIFFWSVGNETSDAADSKWVIEEDTTRIVHARKAKAIGDFVDHDHTNLDMENLLRVTIRGYFDNDNSPQDRNLTPEWGQMCSTEEWQHHTTMTDNSIRGSLKENVVLWLYEDHGADREYRNSPLKHVNYKGWVDLYRIPKYTYYLTQAMYIKRPMIFIHPHNWTPKYLGTTKDFIVNSNCEKVELYANGTKIGEAYPDYENFFTVTFSDVQVKEGTLKAVGIKGETKVENAVTMSGEPSQLKLTVSHDEINAGKNGMAIVTADIVDKNGNRVIHANNTLNWNVEGAGTLVGPKQYKNDFDLFEAMEGTGYIRTPVSNVIRSANNPGKAIVTVSSPGLEPASVEIDVVSMPIENNNISQPKLSEGGRQKVHRDENFTFEMTEVKEVKHISGNQSFDISDKDRLVKNFTEFLQKNSPDFDADLHESKVFTDYFVKYLIRMEGDLIRDDFNFMADKYNDLRLISSSIDHSNLLHLLANDLIQEYAESMIIKGESMDVEEQVKLFINLPKERKIFMRDSTEEWDSDPWFPKAAQKEPIDCYFTDFEELIILVYPNYSNLTNEEKAAYKSYVDAINADLELSESRFTYSKDGFFCIPDPEKVRT